MSTIIAVDWRNLLLAQEVGDSLTPQSSPLDSMFEFPVLHATLDWIVSDPGNFDEKIPDAIKTALKRVSELKIAYRDLVAKHSLPKQFYILVTEPKDDKNPAFDETALDAALTEMLNAVGRLIVVAKKLKEGFWAYRLSVATLERTVGADATKPAPGYWVALDPEAVKPGTRAPRLLLPALEARATLALPAPAGEIKQIPSPGSRVKVSAVDPYTLATVVSQENVTLPLDRSSPPPAAVELKVWPRDGYSELTRAAAALCHYDINGGQTGSCLWDEALLLDPPEVAKNDVKVAQTPQWAIGRLAFDTALKAVAPDVLRKWDVGIDILSAAVWARRLQRAAKDGLTYLNDAGVQALPGWSAASFQKFGTALTYDAANPLKDDDRLDTLLPHVCAYYIAMRLGAASSSSGRSLELEPDATSILGVAGTLRPPELVYVRATSKLKEKLSQGGKDSSKFEEWIATQLAPNSQFGRPLTAQNIHALARFSLSRVDKGQKFDSVANPNPPLAQDDKLGSPALHRALVTALAKAFRSHRSGGMPELLRHMANAGGYSTGKYHGTTATPQPAAAGAATSNATQALEKLLGADYISYAPVIAAAAVEPPIRGSRDIVRLGRGGFVALFKTVLEHPPAGFSEQGLREIWARAWTKVNARAQFIARDNDIQDAPAPATATGLPDLRTLFKQTDLPSCAWGASIHGPAAYLSDMLEFLRHRRLQTADARGADKSALGLLLDKRPDLAEIDLTGANAEVEMPFIDLVCEQLERKVGQNAFVLDVALNWEPAADNAELDASSVAWIETALQPWGLRLREPIALSRVPSTGGHPGCPVQAWILRDSAGIALCLARTINKHVPDAWSVRILPQTTLSSEALMIEPQYVAHQAYDKLDDPNNSKSYTLPWSFGESMTSEHLALAGLTPAELLIAEGPAQVAHGTQLSHARAFAVLGISRAQGTAIFLHPRDYLIWRDKSEHTLDDLTLSKFLERSELGFPDLVALQQTRTFKKMGLQVMPPNGDLCGANADEIKVRWKNQDDVARNGHSLGKFLRLRKHLGWSIDQLDRALTSDALGKHAMNGNFALALAGIETLRARLHMNLDSTLAMYDRLHLSASSATPSPTWHGVFVDTRATGADSLSDRAAISVLQTLADDEATLTLGEIGAFSDATVTSQVAALVAAALRLPDTALEPLIELRLGDGMTLSKCSREDLSHLYGTVVLMRALDLPLAEFGALLKLADVATVFGSPAGALELCDLKDALSKAALSAQSMYGIFSRGRTALPGAAPPPAWRSREQVVAGAQALHAALRALETPETSLLLRDWPLESDEGQASWSACLAMSEEGDLADASAAQALAALAEPIRRLLPRFEADRASLRREATMVFEPGDDAKDRCGAGARRLLADALPTAEIFERELAELRRKLPADQPPAQFLTHELVRKWLVASYSTALQWAGLGHKEVDARLRPWTRQAPTVPLPYTTWLLVRPMRRREIMQQRDDACAAALGSFLGGAPVDAWSMSSAMPAHEAEAADPKAVPLAMWLSQMDVRDQQGGWTDPLPIALEQSTKPGLLKDVVARLSRLSNAWQLLHGLALGKSTFDWLEGYADADAPARRAVVLGALSAASVPGNEKGTADAASIAAAARQWLRLAEWSAVFNNLPDIESIDGSGANVTMRGSVLGKCIESDSSGAARLACCGAMARLHGLDVEVVSGLLPAAWQDFAEWMLVPAVHGWLDRAAETLGRTGLPVAQFQAMANCWHSASNETMRIGAAAKLRKSLRKRFTDDSWGNASRKGQDRLRVLKRDALVAHELGNNRYKSVDDLYEKLLLDTQVAACTTSSRIVQAHAAVQQFAQRCLMGQEDGWRIPMDELLDWKQWDWMRNFRVWEASRKIFLYPENWMDPEIRDDKSQFFNELESDLNQGELSNDNADTAFVRYLHKLHDVARLDIVASYYEFDPDTPVMHVLGRTPSEPRRYFYRQWIDERQWTPWEFVDLEIEGNQILLFKRGGRLYVGWMSAIREEQRTAPPTSMKIEDAGGGNRTVTVSNEGKEPLVRWKLQLSTSERAKEGWQAKRVSPGVIPWPPVAQAMSEVDKKYRPEQLQLLFQDFGIPEILVMQIDDVSEELANGRAVPAYREQIGSFMLANGLGLGVPEQLSEGSNQRLSIYPLVDSAKYEGYRYIETASGSDDQLELVEGVTALADITLMTSTPGRFSVTLAQQASPVDLGLAVARSALALSPDLLPMTMGVGLPMFYSDETIDIAIRSDYRTALPGTRWAIGKEALTSRKFGRIFGQLMKALGSIPVQDELAKFEAGQFTAAAADAMLKAISRAAPLATPSFLLEVLRTVGTPLSAGQTFRVAARNHHPLAGEMVRRAEERGVAHVFSLPFQLTENAAVYRGRASTGLDEAALNTFGKYALSFDSHRDAYACYNWEAFFHVPYTIAMRFVAEAKFADAIRWFNYIFDPTGVPEEMVPTNPESVPLRSFWKMQPFYSHGVEQYGAQRIDILLDPQKWNEPAVKDELDKLADSIMEWRKRPNIPFQLGRGRWVAFQKAVVYRFVETLIAWADSKFRTDTREEITAATQLYVLAGRLLGRKPRTDISLCGQTAEGGRCAAQNYEQLKEIIDRRDDHLSQQLQDLIGDVEELSSCGESEAPDSPHLNFYNEYFCIPPNEKLLELWDRIADRLYKARNCQNIDGITRSLALFAPPIDPALLARAGAAGLSFDQIVAGLNQPRSHYRFATMIQKANEVAGELRTLGNELLQCLEKRDAEELALLRSRLELQSIRLGTDIRDQQIMEAKAQIEALDQQKVGVALRQTWYAARVGRKISAKEAEAIEGTRGALVVRARVAAMKSSAALASMIPRITVGGNGAFGSPHFALAISGELYASSQNFFAEKLSVEGDKDQTGAGITATLASFERRDEDWSLQHDLASEEIISIQKQRIGAEIRQHIATLEKRNLQKSIESAETTDAFLKSKFTNAKLYDWMVRQVSAVYFKTYEMALDLARGAEDCLNRELPFKQGGVRVIQPGYWDGLRKGLMASTGLIHDLKRLELESIRRNKRTPELTKHVSLAVIDPMQLLELRATGTCKFRIPEVLFDLDHPGQFARRIKSVSISIPCITGPYVGVSCELVLLSSEIRTSEKRADDDADMLKNPVPAEAIYTSSASNDAGQFELNLKDERYLPFEGAGAANSEWQVSLPGGPKGLRQFEYASISDVVLQIRYTAEAVSQQVAGAVAGKMAETLNKAKFNATGEGVWVYASLRSDLADQFNGLLKADATGVRRVTLKLPSQLGRWMGSSIVPSGGLSVRVVGQGRNAAASINRSENKPLTRANGFYLGTVFESAEIDGKTLMGPAGFELTLAGLDSLDDVVLIFRGTIASES